MEYVKITTLYIALLCGLFIAVFSVIALMFLYFKNQLLYAECQNLQSRITATEINKPDNNLQVKETTDISKGDILNWPNIEVKELFGYIGESKS